MEISKEHLLSFAGMKCSKIVGSTQTGSIVCFHFGELEKTEKGGIESERGENAIFTRNCHWRLTDRSNKIFCTSNDLLERANGQIIKMRQLLQKTVRSVRVVNSLYDLEVIFHTGECLYLFCNFCETHYSYANEDNQSNESNISNYTLFIGDNTYSILSDSRLMKCIKEK